MCQNEWQHQPTSKWGSNKSETSKLFRSETNCCETPDGEGPVRPAEDQWDWWTDRGQQQRRRGLLWHHPLSCSAGSWLLLRKKSKNISRQNTSPTRAHAHETWGTTSEDRRMHRRGSEFSPVTCEHAGRAGEKRRGVIVSGVRECAWPESLVGVHRSMNLVRMTEPESHVGRRILIWDRVAASLWSGFRHPKSNLFLFRLIFVHLSLLRPLRFRFLPKKQKEYL